MAKTIQVIFVKANNIGLLIEGDALTEYQALHTEAVKAYKTRKGVLDKIMGKPIKFKIDEITDPTEEELKETMLRVIIVKDDDTALVLQGQAYHDYIDAHFGGLKLLGKNQKHIKGKYVKISFF